jgi:hypothetical protein
VTSHSGARCRAQMLHEENDELHRTVDSLEIEVKELRAREVVPKSQFDALEAKRSELQETVWELEELRRSQAWQRSPTAAGNPRSPAGQGSVLSRGGGAGDVSMSEAMMAQEVIADLRRQVADFESHVRARDQAVAAAVAAFDSASPFRPHIAFPPRFSFRLSRRPLGGHVAHSEPRQHMAVKGLP